jgi:hypothetical protein
MDEKSIRSETDVLLIFIERTLQNLMNLPNLTDKLVDVNVIRVEEIVANTIMEYGDLVPGRERPVLLRKIPKAVELALQGDQKSGEAIVLLVRTIIYGASVFNMVANLALAEGEKLADGIKKLGDVFAGNLPEPARTKWYLSLYAAMLYSLELGLLQDVIDYFKDMTKYPAYHHFRILDSLLLSSAVARATRSQPFDLKSLYKFFFVDDKTKISREIDEILDDMKRYNFHFVFVTTRVEPRVLFLSWLLRYCLLKGKYDLKPIIPGDPTGGYLVMIELTDELVREVKAWKYWQQIEQRLDWEFIENKVSASAKYKVPVTPQDPDYLAFKCAGPYVFFFWSLEGIGKSASEEDSSERMEKKKGLLVRPFQKEALTNIAIPFLSYIFPFIRVSTIDDRTFIIISGSTKREALTLFRALAYGSYLSATYTAQLLSGVHALRRLKLGKSESGLDELLERLQATNYGPFLPPETMIRYALLFVDAMLFKLTNELLKRAEEESETEEEFEMRHQYSVFEPTGNFEEDIRRLWEMISPNGRTYLQNLYGIKDVNEFLELVDREAYELFMRFMKGLAALLGVCSAYLAKAYLMTRVRGWTSPPSMC